ncbi:MAG TPA: ATP-binding protein [Thermoclostridium sp.]|nr:ATP-binding protein [Thermoclostridium sp.]
MSHSVFHKIMAIFIIALLLCFTLTAVFFHISISNYVVEQRTEALKVYGERIISALDIILDNPLDSNSSYLFQSLLETFAYNTSSLIWIADDEGYLFAYSSVPNQLVDKLIKVEGIYQLPNYKQYAISESNIMQSEIGSFHGLFDETGVQWLTIRFPFYYSDFIVNGQELRGNVLMHTAVPEIQKTSSTILKLLIPSIFISLFFSFFIVYVLSKRITNPLKQITEAAGTISSGNWNSRLNFRGNDEIAALANSFNQMADDLENLETRRRDFIANISHELRTPMTSINGFIEGIIDGTIPEDKHEYYLYIVKEEVKRLQRLVNDLLDIERMESGESQVNITSFDICEIIRLSVIQLQKVIEEKNIVFRANFEHESMIVIADRDSIQRVLINLLHNAIKFTPEEGNISVSVFNIKGKAEITVSDSGAGIPKEDIPFIFDRFHKVDKSRGKDKSSIGLGLYIVKNIINSHNETITVQSESGKGTTFRFYLPLE